ncbi:MAG: 4-hydroxybenzoate octaprenyltransferase [Candidatus Omnitrophica bacterium]|nr:4-hydroxybenzoate octaprenyltransferase [Candidatus Omnitrophota bacterium]
MSIALSGGRPPHCLVGRPPERYGGRLKTYAGFVKLEHTVFSLPLIYAGALLHRASGLSARAAALILLAAIGGRVMAMGLNRIIDAEIDARNPRTRQRELPCGTMQRGEAWAIVALAGLLYVASAWAIAPICLWLSPIPVALFVVYPYLKRFTSLSHLGLGLAWSMAPLGGWIAASKSLAGIGEIAWLWLFSVLWVTGFDIIYATMDEAFDREAELHSLPVLMGKRSALRVAMILHAAAFLSLVMLWRAQLHTTPAAPWLAAVGGLFLWQHAVSERHPAFAFFQLNGILGFVVFGFVAAGL